MRGRAAEAVAVVLLLSGCTTPSAPRHGMAAPQPRPAGRQQASSPTRPVRPRLRLSWVLGRLPQPLAREAVSPTLDPWHVVVAGGLAAGDTSSRSTYRLDLRSGSTSPLADLPIPVHDAAGSRVAGHGIVIGGGNAAEQSVVQERRRTGWRVTGELPTARSDLAAVSIGSTTYVVGGYDGTSPATPGVLRSRDGRHWTRIATLPVPVRYAAAVRAGAALWVFGGEVAGTMVRVVQRVDLRTGRARVAGRLPTAVGHTAAVRLGGEVLLIGGRTATDRLTGRMWWVHLRPWRVRVAGEAPTPLADSGVATVRGAGYLIGGERPALSNRVLRVSWH